MAAKLQITLTGKEEELLSQKAAMLGYDVTKFVKFLISREAYKEAELSAKTKKQIKKALEDYENGKYTTLKSKSDIKKYVDSL